MAESKELIQRLLRAIKKTRSVEVQGLLQEAADHIELLRPKTIEESLEAMRKWRMTDEELEELMK